MPGVHSASHKENMLTSLPIKLTLDQITAMCQRGFGNKAKLKSVQELGGGTFNETYLVELIGETRWQSEFSWDSHYKAFAF
jgi:hypothetical protein